MFHLTIISKKNTVVEHCMVADSFLTRFWGLMGKQELPEGTGLFITRCKQIHMFFMRFPIDAIFVNADNVVVEILSDVKPWTVSKFVMDAKHVLEVPCGTAFHRGIEKMDQLKLE